MTRPSDADQVITGYANLDGSGEGNWSEETIGRIRNDLGWDERYRTPRASHPDDATLAEFLWSLLTIGLCVGMVYAAGLVLSGVGVAR